MREITSLVTWGAHNLTLECIKSCLAVVRVGAVAYRLAVPDVWRSIDEFRMVLLAQYVFS